MEQLEKLVYSVPEMAKVLGISRSNAYELCAQGVIKNVRLRGRILIPREVVRNLLGSAGASKAA